jgi:hypothetical protein
MALGIPESEARISRTYVKERFDKVLPATSNLIWEEQYDASKEETISCMVPAAEIIDKLQLSQQDYDGYFFDENKELIAYDTDLSEKKNGFIIRQDALEKYLKMTGRQLVWFFNGGKEIHKSDMRLDVYSNWDGFMTYENGNVSGEIWMENKEI